MTGSVHTVGISGKPSEPVSIYSVLPDQKQCSWKHIFFFHELLMVTFLYINKIHMVTELQVQCNLHNSLLLDPIGSCGNMVYRMPKIQ